MRVALPLTSTLYCLVLFEEIWLTHTAVYEMNRTSPNSNTDPTTTVSPLDRSNLEGVVSFTANPFRTAVSFLGTDH